MDVTIKAGRATETFVPAISSKSYVHRLLIAAALSDGSTAVRTNILSKDMEATARVIDSLGGKVEIKEADGYYDLCVLRPLTEGGAIEAVCDCGESGSTARFMLPVASFVSQSATLTGTGKLPERPMGPLCDVLRASGVSVSADHLPITVKGKPHAGKYEIAGNVSSQFISGLLFMLPLLDGDSELKITGSLESAAYVDMTVDVLGRFGIEIRKNGNIYCIPGAQHYEPADGTAVFTAEGDWSNAAYLMAIAALGAGRVFDSLTVSGLDDKNIQGDRAIVDILEQFLVNIICSQRGEHNEYTINGGPKKSIDVDCTDIPDLVPALAVIAAYTDGDSIFRNVGRLRMKECDRIDAIEKLLGAINTSVDITCDKTSGKTTENLIVHGKNCAHVKAGQSGIVIDGFNDHRIVMAATAAAFREDVPVTVKGARAVDKSYPGFFGVVEKLGGNICRSH